MDTIEGLERKLLVAADVLSQTYRDLLETLRLQLLVANLAGNVASSPALLTETRTQLSLQESQKARETLARQGGELFTHLRGKLTEMIELISRDQHSLSPVKHFDMLFGIVTRVVMDRSKLVAASTVDNVSSTPRAQALLEQCLSLIALLLRRLSTAPSPSSSSSSFSPSATSSPRSSASFTSTSSIPTAAATGLSRETGLRSILPFLASQLPTNPPSSSNSQPSPLSPATPASTLAPTSLSPSSLSSHAQKNIVGVWSDTGIDSLVLCLRSVFLIISSLKTPGLYVSLCSNELRPTIGFIMSKLLSLAQGSVDNISSTPVSTASPSSMTSASSSSSSSNKSSKQSPTKSLRLSTTIRLRALLTADLLRATLLGETVTEFNVWRYFVEGDNTDDSDLILLKTRMTMTGADSMNNTTNNPSSPSHSSPPTSSSTTFEDLLSSFVPQYPPPLTHAIVRANMVTPLSSSSSSSLASPASPCPRKTLSSSLKYTLNACFSEHQASHQGHQQLVSESISPCLFCTSYPSPMPDPYVSHRSGTSRNQLLQYILGIRVVTGFLPGIVSASAAIIGQAKAPKEPSPLSSSSASASASTTDRGDSLSSHMSSVGSEQKGKSKLVVVALRLLVLTVNTCLGDIAIEMDAILNDSGEDKGTIRNDVQKNNEGTVEGMNKKMVECDNKIGGEKNKPSEDNVTTPTSPPLPDHLAKLFQSVKTAREQVGIHDSITINPPSTPISTTTANSSTSHSSLSSKSNSPTSMARMGEIQLYKDTLSSMKALPSCPYDVSRSHEWLMTSITRVRMVMLAIFAPLIDYDHILPQLMIPPPSRNTPITMKHAKSTSPNPSMTSGPSMRQELEAELDGISVDQLIDSVLHTTDHPSPLTQNQGAVGDMVNGQEGKKNKPVGTIQAMSERLSLTAHTEIAGLSTRVASIAVAVIGSTSTLLNHVSRAIGTICSCLSCQSLSSSSSSTSPLSNSPVPSSFNCSPAIFDGLLTVLTHPFPSVTTLALNTLSCLIHHNTLLGLTSSSSFPSPPSHPLPFADSLQTLFLTRLKSLPLLRRVSSSTPASSPSTANTNTTLLPTLKVVIGEMVALTMIPAPPSSSSFSVQPLFSSPSLFHYLLIDGSLSSVSPSLPLLPQLPILLSDLVGLIASTLSLVPSLSAAGIEPASVAITLSNHAFPSPLPRQHSQYTPQHQMYHDHVSEQSTKESNRGPLSEGASIVLAGFPDTPSTSFSEEQHLISLFCRLIAGYISIASPSSTPIPTYPLNPSLYSPYNSPRPSSVSDITNLVEGLLGIYSGTLTQLDSKYPSSSPLSSSASTNTTTSLTDTSSAITFGPHHLTLPPSALSSILALTDILLGVRQSTAIIDCLHATRTLTSPPSHPDSSSSASSTSAAFLPSTQACASHRSPPYTWSDTATFLRNVNVSSLTGDPIPHPAFALLLTAPHFMNPRSYSMFPSSSSRSASSLIPPPPSPSTFITLSRHVSSVIFDHRMLLLPCYVTPTLLEGYRAIHTFSPYPNHSTTSSSPNLSQVPSLFNSSSSSDKHTPTFLEDTLPGASSRSLISSMTHSSGLGITGSGPGSIASGIAHRPGFNPGSTTALSTTYLSSLLSSNDPSASLALVCRNNVILQSSAIRAVSEAISMSCPPISISHINSISTLGVSTNQRSYADPQTMATVLSTILDRRESPIPMMKHASVAALQRIALFTKLFNLAPIPHPLSTSSSSSSSAPTLLLTQTDPPVSSSPSTHLSSMTTEPSYALIVDPLIASFADYVVSDIALNLSKSTNRHKSTNTSSKLTSLPSSRSLKDALSRLRKARRAAIQMYVDLCEEEASRAKDQAKSMNLYKDDTNPERRTERASDRNGDEIVKNKQEKERLDKERFDIMSASLMVLRMNIWKKRANEALTALINEEMAASESTSAARVLQSVLSLGRVGHFLIPMLNQLLRQVIDSLANTLTELTSISISLSSDASHRPTLRDTSDSAFMHSAGDVLGVNLNESTFASSPAQNTTMTSLLQAGSSLRAAIVRIRSALSMSQTIAIAITSRVDASLPYIYTSMGFVTQQVNKLDAVDESIEATPAHPTTTSENQTVPVTHQTSSTVISSPIRSTALSPVQRHLVSAPQQSMSRSLTDTFVPHQTQLKGLSSRLRAATLVLREQAEESKRLARMKEQGISSERLALEYWKRRQIRLEKKFGVADVGTVDEEAERLHQAKEEKGIGVDETDYNIKGGNGTTSGDGGDPEDRTASSEEVLLERLVRHMHGLIVLDGSDVAMKIEEYYHALSGSYSGAGKQGKRGYTTDYVGMDGVQGIQVKALQVLTIAFLGLAAASRSASIIHNTELQSSSNKGYDVNPVNDMLAAKLHQVIPKYKGETITNVERARAKWGGGVEGWEIASSPNATTSQPKESSSASSPISSDGTHLLSSTKPATPSSAMVTDGEDEFDLAMKVLLEDDDTESNNMNSPLAVIPNGNGLNANPDAPPTIHDTIAHRPSTRTPNINTRDNSTTASHSSSTSTTLTIAVPDLPHDWDRRLLQVAAELWPSLHVCIATPYLIPQGKGMQSLSSSSSTSSTQGAVYGRGKTDRETHNHLTIAPRFLASLDLLLAMARNCPRFLGRRVSSEVWPVLKGVLASTRERAHERLSGTSANTSSNQLWRDDYIMTGYFRAQRAVLVTLIQLAPFADIISPITSDIVASVTPFLAPIYPALLQGLTLRLLREVATVEPGPVVSALTHIRASVSTVLGECTTIISENSSSASTPPATSLPFASPARTLSLLSLHDCLTSQPSSNISPLLNETAYYTTATLLALNTIVWRPTAYPSLTQSFVDLGVKYYPLQPISHRATDSTANDSTSSSSSTSPTSSTSEATSRDMMTAPTSMENGKVVEMKGYRSLVSQGTHLLNSIDEAIYRVQKLETRHPTLTKIDTPGW